MGFEVAAKIKDALPSLRPHATPAQIASYEQVGKISPLLTNVDDYVIAPMFGYKDGADYYKQSSFGHKLDQVAKVCPAFYLHSQDEIILCEESIPYDKFE